MNIFDLILTQPVFNLLLFLYEVVPGRDLGVAIILFTIIIRFVMWPLVQRQLYHGKIMRELQPQLNEIRKKAGKDRQLAGRLTMELYKEKGVNPFSSIGLLLVQIPFFIALYQAVQIITTRKNQIPEFTYSFMENIPGVSALVAEPRQLEATFLGFVDLTKTTFNSSATAAIFLVAIALLTALLQFIQTKQLMPEPKDKKRLRDLLKAQAAGAQIEQADVMAAATRRMTYIIPIVIFFVTLTLSGALVLYIFASVAAGLLQQKIILREDEEAMEEIAAETPKQAPATKPLKKPVKKQSRAQRTKKAEVVSKRPKSAKKRKRK